MDQTTARLSPKVTNLTKRMGVVAWKLNGSSNDQ